MRRALANSFAITPGRDRYSLKFMGPIISDSVITVNSDSRIPFISALLFTSQMKTCEEMQLENLLCLIKEAGGEDALAGLYGCEPSYIKQMARGYKDSKSGTAKGIGPATARKLESCMSKPRGWLDHDHTKQIEHAALSDEEKAIILAFSLFTKETRKQWLLIANATIEEKVLNSKRQA